MIRLSLTLGWLAYTPISYLQLVLIRLALRGSDVTRYGRVESVSLYVKVLFGNLSSVGASAFSSRTDVLQMWVIQSVTRSTLLKMATSI